ncbi:MAG: DNA-directed RNA polymerase subunit beta, partial [Lachnospiraceae bacterium]|nr:DNA-directed RNA polymerase subunit beta [Lachnospiraceae bacterium]
MEKNKIHQIKSGKNTRMSFAGHQDVLEMPNLIEVQKNSYEWFLKEGLREVFDDISPIGESFSQLSLEFGEYRLCKDEVKYSIEECKERDTTYAAPLKVTVRLYNKQNGEIKDHEIFMGDLPLMTDTGSFVINGAERVIVSQIVRSPGMYFKIDRDKIGKELFSSQIIPNRGAWLEFETDSNDVFYARVDRIGKVPITVLVRALGIGSDEEIVALFGEEPKIMTTLQKDRTKNYAEGMLELYKKIRPGEPPALESAESLINGMLFDERRYDLAHVGRYKYNKKMNLRFRLSGQRLAEDVVDPNTGEIVAEAGQTPDRELAQKIQNTGVDYVYVEVEGGHKLKMLSNHMVEANQYLPFDPEEAGIREMVYYPVLMEILSENLPEDELKQEIHKRMKELVPTHVIKDEILASISYLLAMEYGIGKSDDIDHLGNRRIRAVGELLQNQYRIGMSRMERVVRERMSTQDMEGVTPQSLINIKPVTAAVKEFFGSSQLSQSMDQNNPLSELTHKRRLSALGPGGLSRDRAGFEVRDVHYTHYGRMCPVETPEGPNIGLINSLSSYAKLNPYGFIETPYRFVDKSDPENPVVTNKVRYYAADEEDDFVIAQANTPLDKDGHFINQTVAGRFRGDTSEYDRSQIDLMDVSPRMVFSVATSMIPFLENDDANRALMGSNMQRQAVPLMMNEAPVIDTGLADKVARDSGVCQVCRADGTVIRTSADEIVVRKDDGSGDDIYRLKKFERSNQCNSYNQKPIVDNGEHVEKGQIIADGPSTKNGELALGRNPLIGFMTWEGYNYEDAVLLSERLVQSDAFTSINIEKYEVEARDTKLGPEIISRDIPSVGEDALKDLDEDGIIRIGAEVRAGDILVGKLTPKGETEMTAEERLLRAIFNEKASETRETCLKVPHGSYGTVIATKVYTRENNEELAPGVLKSVRVYIAQRRKISVGDKMAGRHGNKGVVSNILPVEDMPYLPNGRPLDIVLNPLGVPSRMNIGQILETHMSLAAKVLGFDISSPIFDGANEKDIGDMLEIANDYVNTEWDEFKAKYKDILADDVMKYLGEHLDRRAEWKGVPITRDGKVQLRDGRTGEPFDGKTTIGFMHYMKLHHLVDDKIHARSTGPYSLVTQQPLGGKAQFGGQRFGE